MNAINPNSYDATPEILNDVARQMAEFSAKVHDNMIADLLEANEIDIPLDQATPAKLEQMGFMLIRDTIGANQYKLRLVKIVTERKYSISLNLNLQQEK